MSALLIAHIHKDNSQMEQWEKYDFMTQKQDTDSTLSNKEWIIRHIILHQIWNKIMQNQQWSHAVVSWVASTEEPCIFKPAHNMLLVSAVLVKATAATHLADSLHCCTVSHHSFIYVWHSFGWLIMHFSSFLLLSRETVLWGEAMWTARESQTKRI